MRGEGTFLKVRRESSVYRLGFKWPIVDDTYLEKVISAVETLEFFKNL